MAKNWIVIKECDAPKGRVGVEIAHGIAIAHCDFQDTWTKKYYRRSLMLWAVVVEDVASHGFNEIYAPVMDEKQHQFISLFGFEKSDKAVKLEGLGIRPLYRYKIGD